MGERYSELARQVVHMGVGAAAVLLRWLTWPQAAACAAAAVAFNWLVLPRVAGRLIFRPGERASGGPGGIVVYPAAVLALVLVFRERLDIAAAAWAVLAFGDGAATLVGRRLGGTGRWPWNPDKSVAGTLAFVGAGAAAGIGLAHWVAPAVGGGVAPWFLVAGPIAAAIVAGLVETLPVRLDDNLSVPIAAGATLWVLSLVDAHLAREAVASLSSRAPGAGILVNTLVAAVSWRLRSVSISGVIAGWAIGVGIWFAVGAGGWIVLFAGFAAAAISSRVGLARKSVLGIAQERGGRRGAGNALANCLVAVAAAVLAVASPYGLEARVAMVAALVGGASDTVASEIGKAFGRITWSAVTWRRVEPGTIGGMSVEGTAGGVLAALLLASLAAALGVIAATAIWAIVAGALLAMVAEGVLGATLEPRGIVNNDVLNFIETAVAAVAATLLWRGAGS